MRFFRRSVFKVLACLFVGSWVGWATAGAAHAQLTDGAVIVAEFFEEIYQINPAGGAPIDLLNSASFEEVFGHHLDVIDENTAYITSFDELFRFDFNSGIVTPIATLPFVPNEITSDSNGNLFAVEPSELFQIDPTTGAETSIYTETFFGPSDAVVDGVGNIYLTEFFDALGVLTPSGNFSKIGDFATNMFSHIDIGPDGLLYLSTTSGSSFYRVNPATGVGVELDSNVFTFIDDLQVDASGDILFAGEVDSYSGVFRFDPMTKQLTTIVDDQTVNNGFFDPTDIAILSVDETFAEADFDRNGFVDNADLAQLLNAFGVSSAGDADDDGDTDGADVLTWQRQFTGNVSIAAATVPEPSAAILLLCCMVPSCWSRRIRRCPFPA